MYTLDKQGDTTQCVLGLKVYFCPVDSCDSKDSRGKGWLPKRVNTTNRHDWGTATHYTVDTDTNDVTGASHMTLQRDDVTEVSEKTEVKYVVDSHMTRPRYSGRVTGMKLYMKHGALAIGFWTDFHIFPN